MSDDLKSAKPALPAIAAAPTQGPGAVFRISIGPSPELLQVLKENPGGKLTIRLPGDPGYDESSGDVRGPAFAMRSWREDNHACSHCLQPFSVAYGHPPDQPRTTHNVAVRCPACGSAVAVPVPADVDADEVDVRPGASHDRP